MTAGPYWLLHPFHLSSVGCSVCLAEVRHYLQCWALPLMRWSSWGLTWFSHLCSWGPPTDLFPYVLTAGSIHLWSHGRKPLVIPGFLVASGMKEVLIMFIESLKHTHTQIKKKKLGCPAIVVYAWSCWTNYSLFLPPAHHFPTDNKSKLIVLAPGQASKPREEFWDKE